jgi:FeS assembly SUF system regulator
MGHLVNQDRVGPLTLNDRFKTPEGSSKPMLRLSKLTDYAVVVLVRLAGAPAMQTSPGIAAATGIPEPTVAKVLKTLTIGGLVTSQRGARGGYRLHRPLDEIPVADVIAAVDGPIALTACVDGATTDCECHSLCAMRGRWDPVNDAIRHALNSITLADMRMAAVPAPFRIPPQGIAAREAALLPAAE